MSGSYIKIGPDSSFNVDESEGKLVISQDFNLFKVEAIKMVLSTGVAGDNGADGVDGGGSYQSPTPTAVVDGTTFNIPEGKNLISITVIPANVDRILTVGFSAGTGELIDQEEIEANIGEGFPLGRYFHNGVTIHFSGFTGSVRIYLL